jgi:DNA-binding CsgD family transcriptional regulator
MGKIMEALEKRARINYSTPRETLRNLYAKRDQSEVADVLGVTQTTVSAAMRRLSVTARPQRTITPKGIVAQELTRRGRTTRRSANQMFINLYRTKGFSTQEIADQLGVSRSLVIKFAAERGIVLRRVGRPAGSTKSKSNSAFDATLCI